MSTLRKIVLVLWLTLISTGAAVSGVAQAKPVKEILASRAGWKVDKTTGGNLCTVASGDECQASEPSLQPGGLYFPHDAAVNNDPSSPQYGDVYVTDNGARVQIFDSTGRFLGTFGWEVNETKDQQAGATQTEKDICTVASGDTCKAGVVGVLAGQFDHVSSIAVSPATGDVYAADRVETAGGEGLRIQQFTAEGRFVREIGQDVNETTGGNICTASEEAEGVKCKGPAEHAATPTTEPDAFSFESVEASILAFGGPEDLLYVGEEGRVQELGANGEYKGEIPLQSAVPSLPPGGIRHLAVDTSGAVYFAYFADGGILDAIYALSATGSFDAEFDLAPLEPQGYLFPGALAVDPAGRLAVAEDETAGNSSRHRDVLYGVGGNRLRLMSDFADPGSGRIQSLAFDANGDLYATKQNGPASHELVAYKAVTAAEMAAVGSTCASGGERETDVLLDCDLRGEVNPWGVPGTEAWFEWGSTAALGQDTARQPIANGEAPVGLDAQLEGLLPNSTVRFRLAGYSETVKPPEEPLISEEASVTTATVPPWIVGTPAAQFVHSTSAVFFGHINPENTSTEYFFEYEPCLEGSCGPARRTATLRSAAYGKVGATLEAKELTPSTTYRYRLVAKNANGEAAVNESGGQPLPQGEFTTRPVVVLEALTGGVDAVSPTEAVISGEVNPDGAPAVYTFELGVYSPTGISYGIVLNGSAGSGTGRMPETLQLAGLQPGTTYAYRIAVESAYGRAQGEPALFTTPGLPDVLSVPVALDLLAVPPIEFPAQGTPTPRAATCRHGYTRNERGKCVHRKKKGKRKKARKAGGHARNGRGR